MKRLAAIALVALALVGCSGDRKGLGDSPISKRDDSGADIINMPDGYPNIATKCNPFEPGTRIYVVTHSKSDVQPVIVDDPACGARR